MIMNERFTPRFLSREAFAASGLSFAYAFHDTPFGDVIALVCDGALAGLGFADDRDEALAAIREALSRHVTDGKVWLGSATWVVTARNPGH